MGHVLVYASVFVALLLKVNVPGERYESQGVFGIVLGVLQGCMIVAVLGEAFVMICSLRREIQANPLPRFRRTKWIS